MLYLGKIRLPNPDIEHFQISAIAWRKAKICDLSDNDSMKLLRLKLNNFGFRIIECK